VPQLIPAGLDCTVPPPVPVRETAKVKRFLSKVAVTARACDMVSVHTEVPPHAPVQPLKIDVGDGVAESVITVPESRGAPQVAPQSIPAGVEVTVPVPPPALFTVSA